MTAVNNGCATAAAPMGQQQNPPGESFTRVTVLALSIIASVASMAILPIGLGLVFSAVLLTIGFGTYFTSCSMPDLSGSGGWVSRPVAVHSYPTTTHFHVPGGVAQHGARHGAGSNIPTAHPTAPMYAGGFPNIREAGRTPLTRAGAGGLTNPHTTQQGPRHGGGAGQPPPPYMPPQQSQGGVSNPHQTQQGQRHLVDS